MNEIFDLIIIGAGPAGVNAAVYGVRYKLKTLLLGKVPGGAAAEAHEIENLFGHTKITGIDLMKNMNEQIINLKIDLRPEMVKSIAQHDKLFKITTDKAEYLTKKIVLATGTKRRKLGIKNEEKFTGKGFHYCATCDAAFYRDKTVAVVGGGNSALTAALLLVGFAKKVYLIHRGADYSKAEPSWVEDVNKNDKIHKIFNANITELLGTERVDGIVLDNGKKIDVDGVFVEIGSDPNVDLAKDLNLKLTEDGHIKTSKVQETSISGVFAAGDSTDYPLKQIITAASQGAVAAYTAYKEIQSEKENQSMF